MIRMRGDNMFYKIKNKFLNLKFCYFIFITFLCFFSISKVNAASGTWDAHYCTGTCGGYTSAGQCDKVHNTSVGLFRVSFYLNDEQLGTAVNVAADSNWQSMASNAKYHWGSGNTSIVQYANGSGLSVSNGGVSSIIISGINKTNVKTVLSPKNNSANVQKVLNAAGITAFKFEDGKIKAKKSEIASGNSDDACKDDYEINMIVEAMEVITWTCDDSSHKGNDFVGTAYELNNGLLELGYDSHSGGNGYFSGSIVDKDLLSTLKISQTHTIAGVTFQPMADCLTVHVRGYSANQGYGLNIYDLKSEFEIECDDDLCTEDEAKEDAKDGKFREDCCEIEEYIDAYFKAKKENGSEITKQETEACCWETNDNINKSYCDKVEEYSGEDLCGKYCTQKCDATEDIEKCCDICEDDERVTFISPSGKNKGKKVSLTCEQYKNKYCSELSSDCDEKQAQEDASKGSFDKGCCGDSEYINNYAKYSGGNIDDLFKQYCEEESKKCELPPYQANPSCKPADCDAPTSNDSPSNVAWFSDFDENSTTGLMQYIVKNQYGIDLQQTKSNFQNIDQSLLENLAKTTFLGMANPNNNFGGENSRVPVKTSNGGENQYCNLYCQEIAVVALPDFYPGVNAGRYYQWYISGNQNGALVKQQILKVCAEDIKFDKLMEEYYQWMDQVQHAFDKYENFPNLYVRDENGQIVQKSKSILYNWDGAYQWNPFYGESCELEFEKCVNDKNQAQQSKAFDPTDYSDLYQLAGVDSLGFNTYFEVQTGKQIFMNPYTRKWTYWDQSEVPLPSPDTSSCENRKTACYKEAEKYTKDKMLEDIKKQVTIDFKSKFEQYKQCFNVGQDLGIDITSDLKINVTNSLDGNSYSEFNKVENSKDYFQTQSFCFDKLDCELGEDLSFFIYEPIINGKVAKEMTCNGGFLETTLHKDDQDKNKVYNLVSNGGYALPLDYSNYFHNDSEKSLRFYPSGDSIDVSQYAKTFRMLVFSSDTDYVLDNKKAACVCSDGSVVDLEQDSDTSQYYCPCDPEVSTSSGQNENTISEDANLRFTDSSGKCSYTAYTKISEYGSYVVNYSTHSGSYALDINYSNIGSTNNGRAHFSNVSCGASGSSNCSGGSCYYSGQFCKILVGNSLMYDEWSNEKTENWSLHASYYKCRNGECENPDNPVCPNGECENPYPPVNPNCPNGECENPDSPTYPGGGGGPVCTVETCPPNVTPCQNGECANASGLSVIYRSVDMSNPFPGREPGENWREGSSYFSGQTGNRGQNGTSIYNTSNNIEPLYHFELTPATIKQIRNYNAGTSYNFSDTSTIAYPVNTARPDSTNVGLLRDENGNYNIGISHTLREVLAPIIEQYKNVSSEDAVKMVGYNNWCPDDSFGAEYCKYILATYESVMVGDRDCWSHALGYYGRNGG